MVKLYDHSFASRGTCSFTCNDAFAAHLQTCRALMILSLLFGLTSIIVSVLGLKCTKLGRTPEQVKAKIILSGGILFILSGTRLWDWSRKKPKTCKKAAFSFCFSFQELNLHKAGSCNFTFFKLYYGCRTGNVDVDRTCK